MSASKRAHLLHSLPLSENAARMSLLEQGDGSLKVVRTDLTAYISRA